MPFLMIEFQTTLCRIVSRTIRVMIVLLLELESCSEKGSHPSNLPVHLSLYAASGKHFQSSTMQTTRCLVSCTFRRILPDHRQYSLSYIPETDVHDQEKHVVEIEVPMKCWKNCDISYFPFSHLQE